MVILKLFVGMLLTLVIMLPSEVIVIAFWVSDLPMKTFLKEAYSVIMFSGGDAIRISRDTSDDISSNKILVRRKKDVVTRKSV